MKPTKKTLFYTTYIIGITVLFLYYLFPSDAVKDYVAYKMSLENPDISITIDHVSPVLPPGIKLYDVGIAHGNKVLIDLDSLRITPGWLSVFSSTKTTNFKGHLNAGTVDGRVQVDSSSEQGAEKIEGALSGVQVQGIPALQGLTAHKISGSLGGDFIIAGTWPNRSMTGQLTLSDFRISFDQPVIGLPSLYFIKIDAYLDFNKGNLAIKK
jgi:type II secretion system protein N